MNLKVFAIPPLFLLGAVVVASGARAIGSVISMDDNNGAYHATYAALGVAGILLTLRIFGVIRPSAPFRRLRSRRASPDKRRSGSQGVASDEVD